MKYFMYTFFFTYICALVGIVQIMYRLLIKQNDVKNKKKSIYFKKNVYMKYAHW